METRIHTVRQPKKFDFILLTIIILLACTSLIAIYSAFPLMPSYISGPSQLMKQVIFYTLGFICIFAIMYVGNDSIYKLIKIAYFIVLAMLFYLLISHYTHALFGRDLPLAVTTNGATSWFSFPVLGTIQPSEFMKIILIVMSALIIQEHNEDKLVDSFMIDISLFFKILKWAFLPMFLILLQPDTGICIIIAFAIALMLACCGIRKEWVLIVGGLVIVFIILFLAVFYLLPDVFAKIAESSYKMQRIYGWLDVEKYSNGYGMQLYTSLLSIGSSGLFGHGVQSNIITILEPHTDFIFAVIGLNYGFVGCMTVVILMFALDIRLFLIASRTNNPVEKMMITGFIGMLLFQQIENIGMTIGLLPITGVTLPLISCGGSSLLSYMIAFGIIFNSAMHAKKLSEYVYD